MLFAHPLPAEAEAAVDGMAVLFPPVYEIFWSAAILLGLWLALGWALPKIYGMLDERREAISAGLDAADKAKADASLAARERATIIREAHEEAKAIRDDAMKDAGRIVAQGRQTAQTEANQVFEAAQRQIDTERRSAEIALRRDVGALATELAERIIGEQLTDEALSQRVIDRFMDEVEADLNRESAGVDA